MLERPDDRVPTIRVSDADREQLVDELRRHCADGRITLDEFADRVGEVYEARIQADLEAITADLPSPAPARAVDQPRPKPSHWVVGIMSGGIRTGRWRPGPQVNAFAFWGGCKIDFRGAEIEGPEIHVSAVAIMGGIDIVVPEGIKVEITGLPIMGGIDRRIRDVPVRPGTPVIKVHAVAFWGGVSVRTGRTPGRRTEARQLDAVAAAVAQEKPDLSAHALPDGTVTILFSDIEDFTSMTERLGDLRAQEVLRAHNEIVRNQVAAGGGREVKSQGDSFMVAFAGARRALHCAVAMERAFDQYSEKHPEEPIRVRIGLHTGEAIRESDDLFGKSVILAARIAAEAKGGEILVSSLLKQLAESSGEFVFDRPRLAELKGLAGEHELYAVRWREEGDVPVSDAG